jgi:hypothetical protein
VICFSDLRGFTTLAESLEPEALIRVLNDLFNCQVPAIEQHGGEVLKFMGDGMLAILPVKDGTGTPVALCDAACDAAARAGAAVSHPSRRDRRRSLDVSRAAPRWLDAPMPRARPRWRFRARAQSRSDLRHRARARFASTSRHHVRRRVAPVASLTLALAPGAEVDIAPMTLTVRHWGRLREGELLASSPRIDWPRLMRRTLGFDGLSCPKCSGRMRVLSVIDEPGS